MGPLLRIGAMLAALGGLSAAQSYSDPGIETFPDEGNTHVPVGTVIVYQTDPPTSGNHYPDPQSGGYFETPIASGYLVHSMEHGGVIIYYNPATVTDDQKYTLKLLARNHPGVMAMVVCVPRNDPAYPIILTAWTHWLRLTAYDQSRIDGFLTLFLGQGPERGFASPSPLMPTPLISRGKPVAAGSDVADAPTVVDGRYGTSGAGSSWRPPTLPAWIAIQVGSGNPAMLVSWNTPGASPNYNGNTGAPQDYTLATSADSTNGADGTWTTVATVTNNTVRARTHGFDSAGKTWVRLTVTAAPSGVDIDEIDVHMLPASRPDAVFFMGDSISSVAFDRIAAHQPSYAEAVHAAHPAFFPAMIDGGIVGDLSADGVGHLGGWMGLDPKVTVWALGYGTNDARLSVAPATFQANLQAMITQIQGAGGLPVLARIPYSSLAVLSNIPSYNQVIDTLVTNDGLLPGPDLYAWFSAHPGELQADGIHPTDAGAQSINRLWAQALDQLYVDLPAAPAPAPANGAQFVSQVVPTVMAPGSSHLVSVTMRNTGTAIWTAASNFNLSSQNPQNNTTWGMNQVSLAASDTVGPGQTKTFSWTVTAPAATGTHDFQWRMMQTGPGGFGDMSTDVPVTSSATTAPAPTPAPAGNSGGGGGGGCGLLGLEALFPLLLLALGRRQGC